MRRQRGKTLAIVALMALAAAHARAQVRLTASVDNNRPQVGEEIIYSLRVEGSNTAQPQLPDFEGFRAEGRGTQSETRIINGRMSASLTYTVSLVPLREGALTIAPATVTVGGRHYQSNAVTVNVGQAPPAAEGIPASLAGERITYAYLQGNPRLTSQLRGRLFVRPVVSNPSPYVREQVVVSYYLYIAADIFNYYAGYNYDQIPNSAPSLLINPTYQSDPNQRATFESVEVDGVAFHRMLLAQAVYFPLRAGAVPFPLFESITGLRIGRASFFDDGTVTVKTPAQPADLNVKALPEQGRPADFDGAVGDYTISAKVNKTSVKEYDLLTLTVTIEGKGNITGVPDPNLGKIEGIEVYESKGQAKTEIRDNAFGGSKTFEIVLQPTLPGDRTIPPIVYSFFNPRTERYETVKTPPIAIQVAVDPNRKAGVTVVEGARPAGGSAASATAPSVRVLGADIRTIKTAQEPRFERTRPLRPDAAFWLATLIPPGLWGLAWWLGSRRRRLETDHAYARALTAMERATGRLKAAAKALREDRAEAFHAEVGAALRGLVADRTALAAAGATNDDLRQAVRQRSGNEELARRLFDFLETCDAARYSPGAVQAGRERLEAARQLARQLDRALR